MALQEQMQIEEMLLMSPLILDLTKFQSLLHMCTNLVVYMHMQQSGTNFLYSVGLVSDYVYYA